MNINRITPVKPNFSSKIVTSNRVILRGGGKIVYNFDINEIDHLAIQSQHNQRVFPLR